MPFMSMATVAYKGAALDREHLEAYPIAVYRAHFNLIAASSLAYGFRSSLPSKS